MGTLVDSSIVFFYINYLEEAPRVNLGASEMV